MLTGPAVPTAGAVHVASVTVLMTQPEAAAVPNRTANVGLAANEVPVRVTVTPPDKTVAVGASAVTVAASDKHTEGQM